MRALRMEATITQLVRGSRWRYGGSLQDKRIGFGSKEGLAEIYEDIR